MVWESNLDREEGEGEEEEEEEEGGGQVNVCVGLDWKRVLGLHMWYGSLSTSRVAETISQFTRAFSVSYWDDNSP